MAVLNKIIQTPLSRVYNSIIDTIKHNQVTYCKDFELPLAAFLAHNMKSDLLVAVVPGEDEAQALINDCSAFGLDTELFPSWKTLPYKPLEESAEIFSQRCRTLTRILTSNKPYVLVLTMRSLLTPVPHPDYMKKLSRTVRVGETVDVSSFAQLLETWGYLRVPRISVPGEFAVRGEVLDISMPRYDYAIRITLNFDTVEKIRFFDPASQLSSDTEVREVLLHSIKEFIWTDDAIKRLEENLATCPASPRYDKNKAVASLIEHLQIHNSIPGEEMYYPWVTQTVNILSYIPLSAPLFFLFHERLISQKEALKREYEGLYRKALQDAPVPPPQYLLVEPLSDLPHQQVYFLALHDDARTNTVSLGAEPPRSFFSNIDLFRNEALSLKNNGYSIVVVAENTVQADRIRGVLHDIPVEVVESSLSQGFSVPAAKLTVVHESELFGRRKRIPKSLKTVRSKVIETFIELNPGDYIVHANYGIGKFIGIERLTVLGNVRDYIKLAYANEETIFVPIEQVNLVQRFIGNEGEAPRLDTIGSKSWEARKNRVKKHVEDLAERLIRLYSRRRLARGFAFPPDSDWQKLFEAAFPYEETPDQAVCIEQVKQDMEKPEPMDRLICGDVGYGKTEVALRAIFKAVMGGKQAAFLAPTTILAEQHYETCVERFEGFPIRVAMLSRLVDKKRQKEIIQGLADGSIDVVVGTHRILQKDIVFKDLGLLVVDEEQRFGVKDKERLKELKTSIDCLTLTATPIPRTLHMSLLKIRDLSVLNTPPVNRHPIQTTVEEFCPEMVARAIRFEIERGGQVFYLHNRIETLEDTKHFIQQLVPEVMVETAHGQMEAHELEDIMHRFIHKGVQVLVSTTIIENGINIPNVNTIIIDRADMYGISQLYQLRGRVGRSDKIAYAYLLYPSNRALSELAMKRLQIISDFTELGSGFKIAMKDLEVRGAGNLLGREQSGDIYAVGFDLYLKLLEEAVEKLSHEHYEPEEEAYLELTYTGYIPDDYVPQPQIKMELYKKIASINVQEDLESLIQEINDRFGPMPEEVSSLLALAELRILCKTLHIKTLKEKKHWVEIEFGKVALISVEKLLRIIKESGNSIKLDPSRPHILCIAVENLGLREKCEFIRDRLSLLVR